MDAMQTGIMERNSSADACMPASHLNTRSKLPNIRPVFDVSIAALALLVLAPLMVMIALLVRFNSRGPALFRQTRTGLNGRQFQIYKFRTMYQQDNGNAVRQATKGDSRVTRVGAILRKTSLDELPQLFNVLNGEMVLVGPRPHALAHDTYYGAKITLYKQRFAVKPGITGWAQINGSRGETPTLEHMQRRTNLDLWYVQHKSLSLDIKILARTLCAEFVRSKNAY